MNPMHKVQQRVDADPNPYRCPPDDKPLEVFERRHTAPRWRKAWVLVPGQSARYARWVGAEFVSAWRPSRRTDDSIAQRRLPVHEVIQLERRLQSALHSAWVTALVNLLVAVLLVWAVLGNGSWGAGDAFVGAYAFLSVRGLLYTRALTRRLASDVQRAHRDFYASAGAERFPMAPASAKQVVAESVAD